MNNLFYRTSIVLFLFFQQLSTFAQTPNAELVNQITSISVKNGKLYKTESYEIRINSRGGESLTKISIPYSKMNKVSNVEACIKGRDGSIIKKLHKKEIVERSAISEGSFYEDHFIKEFTLKHNEYPYTICYSFEEQEEEFLYIDYWVPIVDDEVPTLSATLTLDIPSEYKVLYSNQLVDGFKADTIESRIKYTWKASYIKPVEAESYSPSIVGLLPKVVIVPSDFSYEIPGSFKSWNAFGDWQFELVKNLSILPAGECVTVQNIAKEHVDTEEKIKALYHYLQDHFRYINITIETGGLKPYPASYVAEKKYGDCKALANYFKSVLDLVGIQSYYTLVHADGPIRKVDMDFPSQQFNHVILSVPMQKDTLWLDCTSSGPFNRLGTFSQNRDALIIEKNSSHFVKTPALLPRDVLETRNVSFSMNRDGSTTAKFHNIYRGKNFEYLFAIANSASESQRTLIIHNRFVENAFSADSYSIVKAPRDSSFIGLSYSATSNKIYHQYGNDVVIDVLPFPLSFLENLKNRKLPLQLDYPIYMADTLEYNIPAGYSVSNKLVNQTIDNDFGQSRVEFKQTGSSVVVTKSMLLNAGTYSAETCKAFYNSNNRISQIGGSHIVLNNQGK